jgi:hypothetical protein
MNLGYFELGTKKNNYGIEIASKNSGKFMAFMIQPATLREELQMWFLRSFIVINWKGQGRK